MIGSQMVLYEEEQRRLEALCTELLTDSLAKSIFLLDKNGQMLAMCGATAELDVTSLASLVAGTVAASGGLAKLMGEEEFPTHVHEGRHQHLHLSLVGAEHILTVIYDERSSLGLVRLRVKKTTAKLIEVFEELAKKTASSNGNDLFAEITDEDIDNLFSDAF
jgi:predicted regulator of Ras-like GTPase activity (Roadblock/LC7/MglB family)